MTITDSTVSCGAVDGGHVTGGPVLGKVLIETVLHAGLRAVVAPVVTVVTRVVRLTPRYKGNYLVISRESIYSNCFEMQITYSIFTWYKDILV